MGIPCEVPFSSLSKVRDAVISVVHGLLFNVSRREEKPSFLRNHEEEHPVDEIEELTVVGCVVQDVRLMILGVLRYRDVGLGQTPRLPARSSHRLGVFPGPAHLPQYPGCSSFLADIHVAPCRGEATG